MKNFLSLIFVFLVITSCWKEQQSLGFDAELLKYNEKSFSTKYSCGEKCWRYVFKHLNDSLFVDVKSYDTRAKALKAYSRGSGDYLIDYQLVVVHLRHKKIHQGILRSFSYNFIDLDPIFFDGFPIKNRVKTQRGILNSRMFGTNLRGEYLCQGYQKNKNTDWMSCIGELPKDVWTFWVGAQKCGLASDDEWHCYKNGRLYYSHWTKKNVVFINGRASLKDFQENAKKIISLYELH
jgi:hypothetical protein